MIYRFCPIKKEKSGTDGPPRASGPAPPSATVMRRPRGVDVAAAASPPFDAVLFSILGYLGFGRTMIADDEGGPCLSSARVEKQTVTVTVGSGVVPAS